MAEKKEKKSREPRAAKKGSFFAGLLAELKRVAWPDRQKLMRSTAAVLIIAIAFALLIWVVDSLVYGGLNLIGFHKTNEIHSRQPGPAPISSELVQEVPAGSSVGE